MNLDVFSGFAYITPPLVATVICLAVLIVVLKQPARNPSKRLFAVIILSLGLWNLAIFLMRSSVDVPSALIWARVGTIFFGATFVSYYHFTVLYTERRGQFLQIISAYSVLGILIAVSPTSLVVKEMTVASYGYAPVVGTIGLLFSVLTFILIFGGIYNLITRYRVLMSWEEKNRIKYLLVAILFPIVGALLDGFTNLPPMAVWFNIVFCLICAVAIVRFRLLDIRIVIRKSLSHLAISTAVAFPFILFLLVMDNFFRSTLPTWEITLIVIFLFSISVMPFYRMIQNAVDQLFFRDKYNYFTALQQFTQEVQSVKDIDKLARTLPVLVSNTLRTSEVGLLFSSDIDGDFHLAFRTGTSDRQANSYFRHDGLLVKWLSTNRALLDVNMLQYSPDFLGLSLHERETLKSFEAQLCVPLVTKQGILSGILILGPKKSEQAYSGEDRDLIMSLANNMAMAIENALLYQSTQRELAERRRIQELLEKSEQKYRTLIENARDSICMVNRNLRVLSMNKAAGELLDCDPEAVADKAIIDILPDELREEYVRSIEDVFSTGFPLARDSTLLKGEASLTLNTVFSPVLDNKGTVYAVIGVCRDMSERQQAEEREKGLLEQLHLANRLASVGVMTAGIAHEVNNPLSIAIGYSDLLMSADLPEDVKEDIGMINEGVLRASKILDGMLAFTNQRDLEAEYTDIEPVLEAAIKFAEHSLLNNNIEIIREYSENLPKTVVNGGQLQEAFLNLILNAESAMKEAHGRGTFRITTDVVKNNITISFSDDGPGIKKELLDKIFDPFFTTKEVGKGTGLGLSISYGIIKKHGGEITVKSTLGKGTTFSLQLPIINQATRNSSQ